MESGNGAPVVVAADLTRRYGAGDTAVDALRGVSVEIAPGALTAVMGPSGSGKSTLMHILAGLDKPTSGTVQIAGTEITTLGDSDLTKLRRQHIGFIFQFFNLLPMLSAEENVLLPLTIAGEKADPAWEKELIGRVGLGDRLSHRPAELSGGQQQRVAIARALVSRPTVVFADEPTGNLDSATSGEILELLRSSVDDYGQTTVMVTHDARAAAMADRRAAARRRPDRARVATIRAARDPAGDRGAERAMMRFALRGLLGRKLRTVLTALVDHSRRRDGERNICAHRLDHGRVQLDLLIDVQEHRRSDHGEVGIQPDRGERDDRSVVRRVAAAEGEGAARPWAPRSEAFRVTHI